VKRIRLVSSGIFVLLMLGFSLLNTMVYAGVLNPYLAWFSWFVGALFISIFKDKKLALVGGISFFLIGVLSAVLMLPSYTFNDATELVISEHGGELVEDYEGAWPTGSEDTSFVKLETAYLVKIEKDAEITYMVHPNTGEIKEFSVNGLVFKNTVLQKTGYMNQSLRLHQDTDFIVKLALTSKLLPGKIDGPVAMWRIHNKNRISAKRSNFSKRKHKIKFWISLYKWSKNNSSEEIQLAILKRLIQYARKAKILNYLPTRYKKHNLVQIIRLTFFLLTHPFFLFDPFQ